MNTGNEFLQSIIKRLNDYKKLADKTLAQLSSDDFYYQPNAESNSISVIIQHMAGNMLSRWTEFLTTDGEKEWRNRDQEFEEQHLPYNELMILWEKGWKCCLDTLEHLSENDLLKTIYIRQEPLLGIDAINRQLAHYAYHVGQMVYVAKIIKAENWATLSIPRGDSAKFNEQMKSKKQL